MDDEKTKPVKAVNDLQINKQMAVDFLESAISGKIPEAYEKYVDLSGRHHNPYFMAGFPALKSAMLENQIQFPTKEITIINVIAEGDLVAVHSHIRQGTDDMAAVHIFRFQAGKIVELWDCGQLLPADSPNKDMAF